jgi:hypothetical protein
MAELQIQPERPWRPDLHAERGWLRMPETHASSIMRLQDDDDDTEDYDDDVDDDELDDEDDEDNDEDDGEEGWRVVGDR